MSWFKKAKKKYSLGYKLSGEMASDAATEGAKQQMQAADRARTELRGDLAPFRNLLSPEQMSGMGMLATDSQTQMDYLQNNPMFRGLMDESQRRVFGNQAARGKLGSGGTQAALQNELLLQGNQLIDQQLNRGLPLLNAAQSSAAQSAMGGAGLITDAAAAGAAGQMGAANAQTQGAQNVAGLAAMFMSDGSLKENIKQVDMHNDLPVYTWNWNKEAEEFGLKGGGLGHIAQELELSHPHLVHDIDGMKRVNYGTSETVEPQLWR